MSVSIAQEAVDHPSAADRLARGKAARARLPRSEHAGWSAPADRRSPVDVLREQALTRVPELVPVRHGRMLVSAFSYYRGAAAIMAADLASLPHSGLITQLCGDAHLSNFGSFAAPDRSLVFDVNDFDETLPGPFEWDLKRLVVSFAVAGRDRRLALSQRMAVNAEVTRAYREAMLGYAAMGNLDVWYSRIDVDQVATAFMAQGSAKQRERLQNNLAKIRAKTNLRALNRLTETVDGRLRIKNDPPVLVRTHDVFPGEQHERVDEILRLMLRAYRATLPADRRRLLERYEYVDAARKVVGVGSVGTRAWILLLLGRDGGDPLVLQAKEAEASVLEPFLGASEWDNHGQRVVEGIRLMQAATDIMLGWVRGTSPEGVQRDFYVRQLWDGKGSALVELMNAKALTAYAQLCGRTLARAHARSGDAIAIAAYVGRGSTLDRSLADFAEAYADQNEQDYREVRAAVDDGTLAAQTGV